LIRDAVDAVDVYRLHADFVLAMCPELSQHPLLNSDTSITNTSMHISLPEPLPSILLLITFKQALPPYHRALHLTTIVLSKFSIMISFHPNCTLPLHSGNFVAAPNVRGTLEIVWSCGSVIILCCWSILHLSVPPQFNPETNIQKLRRRLYLFFRKLKYTGYTMLAPEAIMSRAIVDLLSARAFRRPLQRLAKHDGVPWSLSHTFIANMGGFAICFHHYPERLGDVGINDPETVFQSSYPPRLILSQVCKNCHQVDDPPNHEVDSSTAAQEVASSTVEPNTENITESSQRLASQVVQQTGSFPANPASSTQPGHGSMHGMQKNYGTRRDSGDSDGTFFRTRYRQRIELFGRLFGKMTWDPHYEHTSISKNIFTDDPNIREDPTLRDSHIMVCHLLAFEGNVWTVNASQLLKARRYGIIDRLPYVKEDELNDKNKSNFLVKFLAVTQVVWLIVQLIIRYISKKESSQLEIMTVAFSICAFITYCILWDQPQDVTTPIYIGASKTPNIAEFKDIVQSGPIPIKPFPEFEVPGIRCNSGSLIEVGDLNSSHRSTATCVWVSIAIGALVFGSIHLFAWNLSFPNDTEKLLWRLSSILAALIPAVLATLLAIANRSRGIGVQERWYFIISLFGISVFVLARLCLVVEAFRSLYFLPPEAFIYTWTSNVLHLG